MRRAGLIITIALAATLTAMGAVAPAASAAPSVINVAHRGASAYAPENTVAALDLAADLDADMFEIDVQETKDHKLVLVHDTTLTRTTDAEEVFPGLSPWNVGDLTLAQIRKLDAGSWFGPEYAGEPVPTLAEGLRAMRGSGLDLLLEVKSPALYPGIEGRIAAELRRNSYWLGSGRLVVQSFDWDSMRTFHKKLPRAPIGLLGTPSTGELDDLARWADQINPPFADATASYVKRVHDAGMDVLTWTVNDAADMRRMIDNGVDGIITNRPDVLAGLTSGTSREATEDPDVEEVQEVDVQDVEQDILQDAA